MSYESKERQKAKQRQKYAEDEEYREYHKKKHKEWYECIKQYPEKYRKLKEKENIRAKNYYYSHRESILAREKAKRDLKRNINGKMNES